MKHGKIIKVTKEENKTIGSYFKEVIGTNYGRYLLGEGDTVFIVEYKKDKFTFKETFWDDYMNCEDTDANENNRFNKWINEQPYRSTLTIAMIPPYHMVDIEWIPEHPSDPGTGWVLAKYKVFDKITREVYISGITI